MKRLVVSLVLLSAALIACNQTPNLENKVYGSFEVAFDLDKKTVQVAPKLQPQATVLPPNRISFTQGTLGLLSDVSSGVNYISASFNVNNLTPNPLQDVTLIAYQKTGNRADTALKSLVDFNGTPLTSAQLDFFARAVQPINMPSSLAPFTTNDSIADLQYFQESELATLEGIAFSEGEINLSSGEYLFPYGFVARSSPSSRSIPTGNNQGTVTLALKLPNSNEPNGATSSSYPRRFSMTFVVIAQPLSSSRLSEGYEERRGTSSAATRAANLSPSIPNSSIAQNTATNPSSGIQINGVRTAGNVTNVQRILGERAWQLGTSSTDIARAVATDSSGNVYVAGEAGGNLDGNTGLGGKDGFLTKYDPNGNKQWTRLIGSNAYDDAFGVAIDSSSQVYVTGSTRGRLSSGNNAGGLDVYIAQYNSSGVRLAITQLGTPRDDLANGISTDTNSNVYIFGSTDGNLLGTTAGGFDIFLAKYNSNLVRQWGRQLGTTNFDNATGVAINSSGSVYITGYTNGNLSSTNAGIYDIFLTKYDSDGVFQWTQQQGTAGEDIPSGVTTSSSGDVYVTGNTAGSLVGTNAGFEDIFLIKYDSDGVVQWTRQSGTSFSDFAQGLVTDPSGDIYISGYTGSGLNGNTHVGLEDVVAIKYNSSGTRLWTRQLGTASRDYANAIAIDPSGNLYLAGSTRGGFGGATNAGSNDILLLRLDSLTNVYK
jgi:hypothetical protein